jgi:DegV family protein with EDD domain
LPDNLLKKHQIGLIPFYVSFDQVNYYKENIDITKEAFYETLESKDIYAKTSLPSVNDYISMFKPVLKEGCDILCICLSQKLSGSYQSAINAKQILEEQYPHSVISVIDSTQATGGQGILLLQTAAMKEAGLSLEEATQKAETLKTTARIMFTLNTLEYLAKGRRIGKVISLAKDLLDLKPLIQLKDAELIPYSNIRGRKKALDKVFEMVVEYFHETGENPSEYDFCVVDATTSDDAHYLKEKLETYFNRKLTLPIFRIGVTIGTYTGPGAIGISFIKKYEYIN